MRTRQLVWVALAVCGVVTAQQISTRLLSRQVAVTLREILGGGSLTDVATSMGAFRTNVPPGFLSKPAAAALVFDTMEATISNVTIAAVDSGVGLRFSVTNFYTFDDTSVVSTYNTHLSRSAAASIESITADQAYLSEAKLGSLITERLNASLLGPIGVVTTGVFTASGTTHLGSLEAGDLSVSRIAAPVLRSLPGEVSYYREVGRAAESWTTVSDMTNSWSVVPKPVFDQPNIVTNTLRISTGSYDMIITNLIPVTINYWDTNYADTVVSANASGYTTNVVWLSIYTNQPAGTPVVTNEIQFLRTGSLPNYTFTPTNHVYTNGVPPVVYTNTFANPYLVVDTSEVYTNITTSPVFTYGDLTVVSTNAARRLAPDTGPVGVCTTSYVTRVYEPGVLRTNASGRLYIHEPTAIKPAGSGTKESPFIMSVPENFRWVRENHKPDGEVAPWAYGDYKRFSNDGGGYYNDGYSAPAEYVSAAALMDGSHLKRITYCEQANDIDMLETFLWAYNQWPNGEFVEGFIGISGAPVMKYFPRILDKVPASLVATNLTQSSQTTASWSNLTYVRSPRSVYSVFAAKTWPNVRYAHQLHYNGAGHSLSGIWVGLHPDAWAQARGLLGSAVASPTVKNLTIGGFVSGELPVDRITDTANYQARFAEHSIGGLFGHNSVGVGPGTFYPGYPQANTTAQMLERYHIITNAMTLSQASTISNCVIFMDTDVHLMGAQETTNGTMSIPSLVSIGGAYGQASALGTGGYGQFIGRFSKFESYERPTRIFDSSFVGRRKLTADSPGSSLSANRIIGTLSKPRGSPADLEAVSYEVAFGDGHRLDRNMFLSNTDVRIGAGGAASMEEQMSSVSVMDGITRRGRASSSANYAAVPNVALRTWYGSFADITTELFEAAYLRAGALGYYGNINVYYGGDRYTFYLPHNTIALTGRYSAVTPEYYNGAAATATQMATCKNEVLAGYDRARYAVRPARVGDTVLEQQSYVGIDEAGSGPTYAYLSQSNSTVIVSAASLANEMRGRVDPESNYGLSLYYAPISRFNNPNLIVRSAEEMKKPYVVEPKNAVGGGDTAHDVSYPYRNYSLDDWTQPGDLDGWYPVPRGAAGLTYSNQAAIVTSVWQPANIINLSNDTCVVYATNTTTTTTYRYGDLSFTNYYAVAATQTSPTTCVFTVQNQVYHRHSESERRVVTTTAVVSTNSYQSYERSLSIDSRLVASGPVTVSGTVYRANANSLDPRVEAFVVDTRGNDYGTFRIQGTNVTPVVVAAQFTCTNNAISFVGPAFPIYFEWWPDQRSGAGALISVVRGGTPILLDQFNACDTLDGDHFVFNAPTPGYVIIRRGRPTDGLTLVDAGVSGVPDATRFRTESNAVFQVSFVLASDGPPRMTPLPDSLWTRTNFHGAAATNGISATGAAFIDGTNQPYDAVLRADIFNAGGSRLSDREFFESVSVFCNYAAPEYLIPGEPAILNPVRTSLTSGYVEYPIHVRQLVVLQALGNLGASVTLTLLPGEYLYD